MLLNRGRQEQTPAPSTHEHYRWVHNWAKLDEHSRSFVTRGFHLCSQLQPTLRGSEREQQNVINGRMRNTHAWRDNTVDQRSACPVQSRVDTKCHSRTKYWQPFYQHQRMWRQMSPSARSLRSFYCSRRSHRSFHFACHWVSDLRLNLRVCC